MDLISTEALSALGLSFSTAPAPAPEIDVLDKATFVAHLVEGTPFIKTYELFDAAMTLEFETLRASEYGLIKSLQSKDNRYELSLLLAVASMTKFTLKGIPTPTYADRSWATTRPVTVYLQMLSELQIRSIVGAYESFEKLFTRLLQQADSSSFWQTP